MARATHRLDLYLAGAPSAVEAAWETLVREGCILDGRPGPRELVPGGFVGATHRVGAEELLANGQGGFRVACPDAGTNLVPAFNAAHTAWRAGGPRALDCPCGRRHDLNDLVYRPAATFAGAWIHLVDVASAELARSAPPLPPLVQVLRRG